MRQKARILLSIRLPQLYHSNTSIGKLFARVSQRNCQPVIKNIDISRGIARGRGNVKRIPARECYNKNE